MAAASPRIRNKSALRARINYWRRIFAAYLTPQSSQLTFWHDSPTCNEELSATELGQYYMPFLRKAAYDSHLDANGIPMLDYHGVIGLQYNPIAIAQYGLGNYNVFARSGSDVAFSKFINVAEWLVSNLERNPHGVWVWNHKFDWDYRDVLKAPWYSGLAQGQGISVLVRAFRTTNRERYIEAADRALESFTRRIEDGGVTFIDEHGDSWYEEYLVPPPPTHILNGFMWGSWGLYDHYLATGSATSKRLFDSAVVTLSKNLYRFDAGFWSLYELSGTRMKMLASPFYHRLHIAQLRVFDRLTGEPVFREFADRWEGYERSFVGRKRALAYKSIFKLLYY